MWSFITKIFSNKKDLEITKRLEDLESKLNAVSESKRQLEEEISIYREQDQAKQQRYESDDPWIEITSDDYNPERGLKIGLDWNKAFVEYLKQNNITGITEDDAVRKYIAYLYQDIIAGLEQQSIENSDRKEKISDFE